MASPLASSSRLHDPNFPPALRITSSRAPQQAGDAADADAADDIYADEADIAAYGIAGRIWEAAYLLRLYLRPSHPLLHFSPPCPLFDAAPRLVELGAGVGYAGLHLARQLSSHNIGGQLVLTDLHNVLPLLQRNVGRADVPSSTAVEVMPLPWGDASCARQVRQHLESGTQGKAALTHILCSDLVYFPELLAPLLRSLLHLTDCASGSGPMVVIAYKIRSLEKEAPFWHAFGTWFDFEPVLCRRRCKDGEEWERFGAKMSHFRSAHETSAAQSRQTEPQREGEEAAEEEEDAPDQYFLFLASRRPDTQGALAPSNDAQLLQGWRIWPTAKPSSGAADPPSGEREAEQESREAASRCEMGSGGERFEELLFLALNGG